MTSANWRMGLNAFVLVFALVAFAGLASALTYIYDCQTLSASDTYELDGNIVAGDGTCLTIDAPNVVLDCLNTYSINGPGLSHDATAVLVTANGANAVVRNCQIGSAQTDTGFANGVFVQDADGVNIAYNTIQSPFGTSRQDFPYSNTGAITLMNSDNSFVSDNNIDLNSEWGIKLQYSNSDNVLNNHVTHAAIHGIYVIFGSNNAVNGNTVWETGWNGDDSVNQSMEIELLYTNGNTVANNNVYDTHIGQDQFCAGAGVVGGCEFSIRGCATACGIMLKCGSNNQFLTNTVDNFETGIGMVQTHGLGGGCDGSGYPQDYNIIRGNTVTNTFASAIKVFDANNTIIDANSIPNAYRTGISYTGNSYYGTISNNVVRYTCSMQDNVARAGLTLASAYDTAITGNTFSDGYVNGILFSQDNDDNALTGNTISNNQMAGVILGMHVCPLTGYGAFGDCVDERNTFMNNVITYNAKAGGYINFAKNANIVNFIYDQSGTNVDPDGNTWRWSGGQNNRFIDNTILNDGSVPDVSSGGDSSIYFINTPIVRSTEDFMSLNIGNVTVSWYLDVHVQDVNGLAVSSAQVTITNGFGTIVYSGTTDASGNVPRQTLPEYFDAGDLGTVTNSTNSTPYSVAVTNGCAHVSASTPLTSSTALTLTLDVNAPVISNIRVIDVTQNTVTLGWDTSEPANETLEYGTTTAYGSLFTNAVFATGHSAFLSGLSDATPYHYRINACDAQCNCASASDYTFTTTTSTGGGNGGGGNGGGNGGTNPTVAPTTAPTTVPTAGPTTAPTTAPGGVTPTPTVAPTVAGTIAPTPTIAPGTGLVTAAGPDYGLWGGILLLLILLALLIYWYMRRKKKKD